MPRQWQAIIFIAAVAVLIIVTTPEGRSPGAIIDADISQTSVTALPDIFVEEKSNSKDAVAVQTTSALAKEVGGNKIFYEQNPGQRWPLASLTKLMTAMVALESVPVSPARDNALKKMMVTSDNEAAGQLAAMLGAEKFVGLMNSQARDLKMTNTSFFDSSGLSFLNQSTVLDLDRLVSYLWENQPLLLQWSRQPKMLIDGLVYDNINQFAGQPGFLGGKTGWTNDASGNLISIFQSEGRPLAIIILGAANKTERFTQTEKLRQWISQHFKR